MIEVEAPDGTIVEFPEGTSQDVIKGVMSKNFAPPVSRSFGQGAMYDRGRGDAFQRGITQGATFQLADELFAGAMTPVEMGVRAWRGEDQGAGFLERAGNAYTAVLDDQRAMDREAEQNFPVSSIAANIGGSILTGGELARGGATLLSGAQPTMASMAGRGAAEGALYGAAHGFGGGEGAEDRAWRAGEGAAIGGVVGGGVGAYGARSAQRAAERAAPDAQSLRNQANQLYQQAEQAGIRIKPKSFQRAVDDITKVASEAGIDRTIHPKATAALARLQEARAEPLTLQNVDTLRRVIGGAAKSLDADERRIASMMINSVDDYLQRLSPSDITQGNARQAQTAIKQARDYWSRFRKSEIIEDLFERAGTRGANFSGSGRENALRAEFRTLSRNARKMRPFSKEERAAIIKVARGGPMENALRMVGKFAPTGIVSSTLGGGAGYAVGGPLGALGVMGAGAAARHGATRMTQANADRAAAIVRSGGQLPRFTQLSGPQRLAVESAVSGGASVNPNLRR